MARTVRREAWHAAAPNLPTVPSEAAPEQAGKHPKWKSAARLLLRWLHAALAGVSALGLLRVLAPFLGFTVKINAASLALSALLGTPGVLLLLVLRLFFWVG